MTIDPRQLAEQIIRNRSRNIDPLPSASMNLYDLVGGNHMGTAELDDLYDQVDTLINTAVVTVSWPDQPAASAEQQLRDEVDQLRAEALITMRGQVRLFDELDQAVEQRDQARAEGKQLRDALATAAAEAGPCRSHSKVADIAEDALAVKYGEMGVEIGRLRAQVDAQARELAETKRIIGTLRELPDKAALVEQAVRQFLDIEDKRSPALENCSAWLEGRNDALNVLRDVLNTPLAAYSIRYTTEPTKETK